MVKEDPEMPATADKKKSRKPPTTSKRKKKKEEYHFKPSPWSRPKTNTTATPPVYNFAPGSPAAMMAEMAANPPPRTLRQRPLEPSPKPPAGVPPPVSRSASAPEPGDSPPTLQIEGTFMRDGLASALLFNIIQPIVSDAITPGDVQSLRKQAVEQCNDREDLYEVWLAEQVMLLQVTSAIFHSKSACAGDTQMVMALNSAACRVTGELRRTVLTLLEYRAARGGRRRRVAADGGQTSAPTIDKASSPPADGLDA